MVICPERGADLHMMPLPLTVSCFSKIQIGFTFLVPAHPGSPGKGSLNGCVRACVCAREWIKRNRLLGIPVSFGDGRRHRVVDAGVVGVGVKHVRVVTTDDQTGSRGGVDAAQRTPRHHGGVTVLMVVHRTAAAAAVLAAKFLLPPPLGAPVGKPHLSQSDRSVVFARWRQRAPPSYTRCLHIGSSL